MQIMYGKKLYHGQLYINFFTLSFVYIFPFIIYYLQMRKLNKILILGNKNANHRQNIWFK